MENKNTLIVNDERVANSYGFRVKNAGLDTTEFESNPVMLLNHNYDKVMGTIKDLKKDGHIVTAVPVFDMEDEEAVKIEKKVTKNLMKGASMGILPLKAVMGEDGIPDVTESTLVEITITPLPSNKAAIKLYAAPGQELPKIDGKYDLSHLTTEQTLQIEPMNKKEFFIAQLSLEANATEEVILKAVQELVKDRNEKTVQLKAATETIETYKAAEVAAKDKAAIDMVKAAVTGNKILAADEEKYVKLAKQDMETTKGILDSMTPMGSYSEKIKNEDKYKDWDFNKFQKEAPVELSRIKTEEPDRYKALLKTLKTA